MGELGPEHTSHSVAPQVAAQSGGPEHTSHFLEPQVATTCGDHMWLCFEYPATCGRHTDITTSQFQHGL